MDIGILINKFKTNTLTSMEREELENWIAASVENKAFFEKVNNFEILFDEFVDQEKVERMFDTKKIWDQMVEKGMIPQKKMFWLSGWKKYSVAAILVIGLTITCYIFLNQWQKSATTAATKPIENTSLASHSKAILTLWDGRKIELDSAASQIFNQNGTSVQNKNGELIYSASSSNGQPFAYNTLSTPKGQMYATILSDGSKVWLAPMSSLKYPVVFNQQERSLQLTGEAYFEVKQDSKRPFRVFSNGTLTEVLGTSFNIKSLDTSQTRTTLLEGGVKISSGGSFFKILKPGEQAQVVNKRIVIKPNIDVDEVMAWKNRMFIFNGTEITEIMNELQRWYDIDVRYVDNVKGMKLRGQISRDMDISKVLETLEIVQEIHFKLEGRTVIVSKNDAY